MGRTQQWLIFVGRLLLGLSFLGAGIAKIGSWGQMVKMLAASPVKDAVGGQMIPVVLVFFIILETVGGFLMTTGYRARLGAGMCAIVVAVSLAYLHQFWGASGPAFIHGYFDFVKDTKVLGGLMLLMAFGPGRLSVDGG